MTRFIALPFLAAAMAACAPARAEDVQKPKTFTLTEAQAQDYANRLQAEMRVAQAQYEADKAILDSLMTQARPEPPKKAAGK